MLIELSSIDPFVYLGALKWITKTLDLRTDPFSDTLFSIHQNAFIKKRFIVDGILSSHELMHTMHMSRSKLVL